MCKIGQEKNEGSEKMKEVYIEDGPFIKTDNQLDKLTNNILISL